MPIRLVCVGKLGENHFKAAAAEYVKRIARYMPIEVVELADEPLDRRPERDVLRLEGDRILKSLPKDGHIILADSRGAPLTSEQFASRINDLLIAGRSSITFVCGGSLGVDERIRKQAADVVSFSRMTMGHQLARVVLLEQIYRAFTIIRGEKYHR